MSQDLLRCGKINLLVYLLVILFGVSSWVDINGLWVELPILVQNLPEGWDLPSYMAVIIQVANVAPLAYTVASTIYPHRAIEVPVIYVIISTGAVSCLLLSFFWDKTSIFSGTEHSTALFVLQFFLALVDCTSSVAFLPFMSRFKAPYMTAYFIGEGFSGLIPSLVALGQGAGSMKCVNFSFANDNSSQITSQAMTTPGVGNFSFNSSIIEMFNFTQPASAASASYSIFPQYQPPKFTVEVFFLILMGLLLLSALSFTLLNYWSYCKTQYVVAANENDEAYWDDGDSETDLSTTPINGSVDTESSFENVDSHVNPKGVIYIGKDKTKSQLVCVQNRNSCKGKIASGANKYDAAYALSKMSVSGSSSSGSELSYPKKPLVAMSKTKYVLFMCLTAWLCALSNGVLPSIQTYSCLPYGIQPYHLSVTLASIANPAACFATFFLKMTSITATVVMSVFATLLSAFILFTAATSPEPPLVDHSMGAFIIILSWVLGVFVLTYTKVAIATVFRQEGRKALLWVGANTQLGSLIGAVVIFVLVNNFKLFKVANPCI